MNKNIESFEMPKTVGELVEVMRTLPQDASIDIDGSILIGNNNTKNEEDCINCRSEDSYIKKMHDMYQHGCAAIDNNFLSKIRNEDGMEKLITCVKYVSTPNEEELNWEAGNLSENQLIMLDCIRNSNMMMVETMTEMYRRQMSSMLEYMSQSYVRYIDATNNNNKG